MGLPLSIAIRYSSHTLTYLGVAIMTRPESDPKFAGSSQHVRVWVINRLTCLTLLLTGSGVGLKLDQINPLMTTVLNIGRYTGLSAEIPVFYPK